MSIVLELQELATNSNSDILSLLRKALIISHKLNLIEAENWINKELNAYQANDPIPTYRMIKGTIMGINHENYIVPANINLPLTKMNYSRASMEDSIPNLQSLLKNNTSGIITQYMPAAMNSHLSKISNGLNHFQLHISTSSIYNIFDQVQTRILKWTMILEDEGILGEGLDFSQKKKNTASDSHIIQNITNNFYGDASNNQFQQGTNDSRQNKE